jgi:hypothetical protein
MVPSSTKVYLICDIRLPAEVRRSRYSGWDGTPAHDARPHWEAVWGDWHVEASHSQRQEAHSSCGPCPALSDEAMMRKGVRYHVLAAACQ